MSLGAVQPWVWGKLCRHLEAELPRRTDLDAEARKGVEGALSVMLHSAPPREWEGTHSAVCSLCGRDRSVGLFIHAEAEPGGGARFRVVGRGQKPKSPGPVVGLVCWSCLYDRIGTLEVRLELARRLLVESKDGASFLPLFDEVFEQRLIRRVGGSTCGVCGRVGTALRGPPGVLVCLTCCAGAQDAYDEEQRAMRAAERRQEEDFDARVAAYLAEMWQVAREDAAGAIRVLERRGDLGGPPRGPGMPEPAGDRWSGGKGRIRPPIPQGTGRADERARDAIRFLDDEVERAIRHERGHRDLMGDRTGIHVACAALDEKGLSRPMLGRFLESISMLRQVIELGILFHAYTGDELIHEEISDYEHLASRIAIGVHAYVDTAMTGGLVVSGGTAAERGRAAGAIRRIVVTRTRMPFPSWGSSPFQYIEAEALYSMSPASQEEVRRLMLVTPPVPTVFGADDLDRFIEETPKRCSARIVTYLFMNGQEHLNLNDGRVHVGPPPPGPIPTK